LAKVNNKDLLQIATKGFYATTIPDIAKSLQMSVGNIYNYFRPKDILAKEILKYISKYLGAKIREIFNNGCEGMICVKWITSIPKTYATAH